MYKLINGWTKAKVLEQFKKYNNGSRALASNGVECSYLALGGNRCAVGAFIPDGHRALTDYTGAASHLLKKYPELASYMPFDPDGLQRFQTYHDKSGNKFYSRYENEIFPDFTHDSIVLFLNNEVE